MATATALPEDAIRAPDLGGGGIIATGLTAGVGATATAGLGAAAGKGARAGAGTGAGRIVGMMGTIGATGATAGIMLGIGVIATGAGAGVYKKRKVLKNKVRLY
jgi:hypothetical protein